TARSTSRVSPQPGGPLRLGFPALPSAPQARCPGVPERAPPQRHAEGSRGAARAGLPRDRVSPTPPPHRPRLKSVTRPPEGLNADRTFGWPITTRTQSGSFWLSATFRAETSSPVLSAGVTVPSGVLWIPRHRAAADGAGRGHGGRRVRGGPSVCDRISAPGRMVLADHEIDDQHDHKADDGPKDGPAAEAEEPQRRSTPPATIPARRPA